ncbi:MAG: division/cell wall cluster transcriptional repressor MraZ [Armatimonadota bacterium]
MFSGAYSHSVDSKGRTVIPARFRSKLGERFYLTRGMHGCLWIFSEEEWREFQNKVAPKSFLDGNGIKLERFFVGSAVECMPDGQGRIAVPQNLREYAGIEDEIWVVGLGKKVEIWSDAKWQEFNNSLTDEVIEALGSEAQPQE